ncbi:MAG: hypothetical protein GF421_04600 [Candidatus Aminicenantes bacterium]|nr:hypothetical protein [Candidatus Aminicenantes bacterium]
MNSDHNTYSFHLFNEENKANDLLSSFEENNFLARIKLKDWSLWAETFQPEIVDRLGWLELPVRMKDRIESIEKFTRQVKKEQFSDVILLGMGGSSLAPDVFQKTFPNALGFPKLTVCDSTHPEAVERIRKDLDLKTTLFIVSSKSGTTLETMALYYYFWSELEHAVKKPGNHFIAITDHSTPLMKEARERGFRKIFNPFPDVGGRFSVFTEFGLVPASIIGMDPRKLLESAEKEPNLSLGAALAAVGEIRDKLIFVTSKSLRAFPDWLEQLAAESLGKDGRGIIPVIDEPLDKAVNDSDRFFVFFGLDGEDADINDSREKLKDKEIPYVDFNLSQKYELGEVMFQWEVAVAAAGSYLKINPFDQPDVQAAKDFARSAMNDFSRDKTKFSKEEETISVDDAALKKALGSWLSGAQKGDYAAIQAYLAPSQKVKKKIQDIRAILIDKAGISTTMGYGPRYLHSTGQLHKGGPNKGLFLQIVDSPQTDIRVPGKNYSFQNIIKAQSLGDFQALKQKSRRVLRVDLKDQTLSGLSKLAEMICS